jgi:hypothetical protein
MLIQKGINKLILDKPARNPTQAQIDQYLFTTPQTQPFYIGLHSNVVGLPSNIIQPGQDVSRTGYKESEVVPPITINFKLSGGLY